MSKLLKLNIKERKIAYQYCKNYLLILGSSNQYKYVGICTVLNRWINDKSRRDNNLYTYYLLKTFPELAQFKTNDVFWWPRDAKGLESRIKALTICIQQIEEKQGDRLFNLGMLAIMMLAIILVLVIVITFYIMLTR